MKLFIAINIYNLNYQTYLQIKLFSSPIISNLQISFRVTVIDSSMDYVLAISMTQINFLPPEKCFQTSE